MALDPEVEDAAERGGIRSVLTVGSLVSASENEVLL
jgi:hypothetical protein